MRSLASRSLVRLSVLAGLASALAWTTQAALDHDLVPRMDLLVAFGGLAGELTAAAVIVVLVTVGFRAVELGLRRTERRDAIRPLTRVENGVTALLLLAFFVGVFVDVQTALVSLGLAGFALTLALQRPILALAGWVQVTFNRPFREGDRIEVEGIQGDVLEINLFSTRLWELSSEGSPLRGSVTVADGRATGRTITISNAVFVESPVANATGDVQDVFDEFVVTVAYEADRELAETLLLEAADEVLDPTTHARSARVYERLTRGMSMEAHFPREPTVLETLGEDWIELRLRYLVPARGRASVRRELAEAWLARISEHPEELPNVYPRRQVMQIGEDGRGLDT